MNFWVLLPLEVEENFPRNTFPKTFPKNEGLDAPNWWALEKVVP